MGIKSEIKKATRELASRPTRSRRKKDALASKAEAAALAAAAGKRPRRPRGKGYGAEMLTLAPQGLAATLRRKPTAGSRSRPSLADTRSRLTPGTLSQLTRGRSSRKRSR